MPLKKLILMSTILSICFLSCEKNNISSLESELPEQTTLGLNTFGCLIDNQVWIPTIDKDLSVFTEEAKLTLDKKTGSIVIEATSIYKDLDLKIIKEKVRLSMTGINEPGSYSLVPFNQKNNFPVVSGWGSYTKEGIRDKYTGTNIKRVSTGELEGKPRNLNIIITRLDFEKNICSGTFEFDPFAFFTTISIDEMKIRKGRFDLKSK